MGGLYKPIAKRGTFISYKSWELPKASSSSSLVNQTFKGSSAFVRFVKRDEQKCKHELNVCKKKPRRCWTQELHGLFVHAIEQLGDAQDATPKQIKEVMNVKGLTNDEVKSHLQASHPITFLVFMTVMHRWIED